MHEKLKINLKLGRALAVVAIRRARLGPRCQSWSLRYEAFIEFARELFRPGFIGNLDWFRPTFDLTGDREENLGRSIVTDVDADGIHGKWVCSRFRKRQEVIYYLHGGGYQFGSTRAYQTIMGSLAQASGAQVFGIDYRLAPEHTCPAALEDAVAGYQQLLDQGHHASQIAIVGDSAGGGLSVASLVAIRDQGLPLPAAAVLLSPWVDLTLSALPDEDRGFDYIFPHRLREQAEAKGYEADVGADDPRASPLFADLEGLPPLLIIAGELETLVDDSRRLAERAERAGVIVQLHVEPEEVHVYAAFNEVNPRAQAAFGRIAEFLDRRWSLAAEGAHSTR